MCDTEGATYQPHTKALCIPNVIMGTIYLLEAHVKKELTLHKRFNLRTPIIIIMQLRLYLPCINRLYLIKTYVILLRRLSKS